MRKVGKFTTEEYVLACKKRYGEKFSYDKTEYKSITEPVVVTCNRCGKDFEIKAIRHLYRGSAGCPNCDRERVTTLSSEEYFKRVKEKYGDLYLYDETSFKSLKDKISLTCRKHNTVCHPSAGNHLSLGTVACPECKREATVAARSLTQEEVITRARVMYSDNYDYSESIYTKITDKIKVICKLHGAFYPLVKDHLTGKAGCPQCARMKIDISKRIPMSDFLSRANIIHNNKYTYELDTKSIYAPTSNEKICITCPLHGKFYQRVGDHLQGVGCPTCNESLGEKAVAGYLEKKNLVYEREKCFEWLVNPSTGKYLPLDFYIDELKLAIEVDGGQHRNPVKYFGGSTAFQNIKYKDALRDDLCRKNGIILIRVVYSDKREIHKTIEELNKYF